MAKVKEGWTDEEVRKVSNGMIYWKTRRAFRLSKKEIAEVIESLEEYPYNYGMDNAKRISIAIDDVLDRSTRSKKRRPEDDDFNLFREEY